MIRKKLVLVAPLLALCTLGVRAELPVEQITTKSLPPAHPHRLYLTDFTPYHMAENKLMVIDGRNLKIEATISTGSYFAQNTLSPDRSEIYVATTYYSKLNHGDRHEEVVVYDANTMAIKEEIPYPARHAQAVPYIGTLRASGDGKFIFVLNATPATSIGVVNRQTGKFVTEVPIPGCYAVYPAHSGNRVSTLCGDGTMITLSLDEGGNVVGKKKSAKFFDPEADALFISAPQDGDVYHFLSFQGNVVSVNVAGESAVAAPAWPLAGEADRKQGWRPGGYQPAALHQASGTLYVGVHPKGAEGSHKNPATEIWAFDLASKKRVGRIKTHDTTGLATSQGEQPRLYALATEQASITAYDGLRKLKKVATERGYGEAPNKLETQ